MKSIKRFAVLTLALLCCVCLLASCGEDKESPTPTTPAPTSTAQTGSSDKETYTGEGIYRVAGEENEFSYLKSGQNIRLYHWWFNGEEGGDDLAFTTDEIVGSHRRSVIDQLKNEYGVTLTFVPQQAGGIFEVVWQSANAGSPIVDGMHAGGAGLVLEHVYYEGTEGAVIEPIDGKGVSFSDEAFWNVEQQDKFTNINGKTYAFIMNVVGIKSIEANKLVFMNYNLINNSSYTVEEIYDMVRDGKWTWDKFKEIIVSTSDPDQGIYGLNSWDAPMQLGLANGGEIIGEQDVNGEKVDRFIGNNSSAWQAGWDFVSDLYNLNVLAPQENSTGDSAAATDFATGNTTFMINHFNRSDNIRNINKTLQYGYLPIPKGPDTAESDGYYSQGAMGECFMLLKNSSDKDHNYSGILKTMKELYRPVFGKDWAQNQALFESQISSYTIDENSREMCDLIIASTKYPAHLKYGNFEYNIIVDSVVYPIITGATTFSQYFDSNVGTLNTVIDQMLKRS